MEFIKSEIWDFTQLKFLEKYLEGHNGFVAGGCFKNIFNKEKFKDIDLFFKSKTDWVIATEYYDKHKDYNFYYENPKVKAFKNIETGIVVECINEIFGTPEEIISAFDFSITQFVLFKVKLEIDDIKEEKTYVQYNKNFFTHLHLKRLVIDNIDRELPYVVSTYNRLFKYGKYGFFPCRGTKIKIISELRNISDEEMQNIDGSLYDGID